MKKLVILLAMFLGSLPVISQQENIVKFYLEDGTTKQYSIDDIQDMSFLKGDKNYEIVIYSSGTSISEFPTEEIESMKFEIKDNDRILNIYITGSPNTFILKDIDSICFKLPQSPLPEILSINPSSLRIGDELTITGKNFGDIQGSAFASFNGTNSTDYPSWSNTEIWTKVPPGSTSGKLSVTVNQKRSNEMDFIILAPDQPQVTGINPINVNIGDIVTISGTHFTDTQGTNYVSFNSVKATDYSSWTETGIQVRVPAGSKTGKVFVSVDDIKSNEVQYFVIPSIISIKESSARIADEVLISGNNFGTKQDLSQVTFNKTVAVDYTSWTDTLVEVKVPKDTESGKVFITVNNNQSNMVDFSVLPFISALNPAEEIIGNEITLSGSGFKEIRGTDTVFFNNIKAVDYSVWSDTLITVKVPNDATTGKVSVNINGIKSNGQDFIVIPYISVIEPSSAGIGDIITIRGTGMAKRGGTNAISFKGVDTYYTSSWISTEIILEVPVGAETGKVAVKASERRSNEVQFTVAPKILSISPNKFTFGNEVTINGTSFGNSIGTSIVTISGINATEITSWSSTKIVAKVPSGVTSGKLSVTVEGTKSNEVAFTIYPVYITGINPSSAGVGDTITISGYGFGNNQYLSLVTFNGINATKYPQWTDTEIRVKVPGRVKTGKVYVTVNSERSNEVDFTSVNTFLSIIVANQEWMVKNLDVTTYRNGDPIPEVTDENEWRNLTTGAWCYYNNNSANGAVYGKLYNWYAMTDSRGLAPEDWHIPTSTEWRALIDSLGGNEFAGGSLKETGLTHWNFPNGDANNESGFTALPSGFRDDNGIFSSIGDKTYLGSVTVDSGESIWCLYLNCWNAFASSWTNNKKAGFPVRCIRD